MLLNLKFNYYTTNSFVLLCPLVLALFERVRTRMVMVVVRALLATTVICMWIRGHRSEVTDQFCSDFHLQLRSYQSGFIVLFPCCDVNIKLIGIL